LYKQRNEDESGGSIALSKFFKENSIECKSEEAFQGDGPKEDRNLENLFESLKIAGDIVNFNEVEGVNAEVNVDENNNGDIQKEANEKSKEAKADNEEKPNEGKETKRKVIEDKKVAIRESEINIIENKSVALRTYLTDNVMDKLTEGLIETCKTMPEDPIDFLADFLEREAQKFKSRSN